MSEYLNSWSRRSSGLKRSGAIIRLTHLISILFFLSLNGCFLFPAKKSNSKANSNNLVDPASVVFDRMGDGTSARLQFKTKALAACELAYYAQDTNIEPKQESPKLVSCANIDAGRLEFTEKIDDLRTDTLYNFLITVWPIGNKAQSQTITFKEPSADAEDDPNAGLPDGKVKDLFIARFNTPLRAAEIYRHTLNDVTDVATIRQQLTLKTGCQQGIPSNSQFVEANPKILLTNLVTREFATATAAKHPNYPERLQLSYPKINEGLDRWTISYKLSTTFRSITARPVARLVNVEMQSSDTNIEQFEAPQLAKETDKMEIDPARPLKISWTTSNSLPDLSFVTVNIGRAGDEKAIYCAFPAAKKTGEIDSKLLQNLDIGTQVILVELNSTQIWAKEAWAVSISDWRSARIERKN